MSLLLDTHVLVWWIQDSTRLGKRSRRAILQAGVSIFISSVSLWELAVKVGMKQLKMKGSLRDSVSFLLAHGFQSLPVTFEHALAVQSIPPIHRDPFDRMLIAQAQCDDLTILTSDSAIEAYDVRTLDASE